MTTALPPVVDAGTWQAELDALRAREKAATREPGWSSWTVTTPGS
jgi:hypothetical protein